MNAALSTGSVLRSLGSCPANTAKIRAQSSAERAKALIALAHPQFREGLTKAAREMHLI